MQIILLAAISADGKIAQREGQTSLDWTSKEDLKFFIEKTKEVGVVIMGRKTFETIGKPLKGRRLIVLTNRPVASQEDDEGIIEFTNEQPRDLLARLQNKGHDRVVVAGGASVYSQFLREGLVTDVFLTVEPVLFGQGVPLATDFDRINLKLIEIIRLSDQTTVLHFRGLF